jgi:molybdate-binding protein
LAVRLGVGSVRGLSSAVAREIETNRPFVNMEDLVRKVPQLHIGQLEALATAGAFNESFGQQRRDALWSAGAVIQSRPDRLQGVTTGAASPQLPGMQPLDEMIADLWATGVASSGHPTEFLRTELERSYALAFDDSVHVLTLYASHDEAISQLREHALRGPVDAARLHLDVRFTGSVDAIRALNEGRCILAGFHTLMNAGRKTRSERTYKPLLQPGLHKIIGFSQRTQGLMLAPGNPLALYTLADVAHTRARFANRALGSGTRVVLDELLDLATLTSADLAGYDRTEPSHAAVAQAVASGQCDVGLGIEASAQQAGLDYVPLVNERYHLVCLKSALTQPGVVNLLQLLQTPDWQAAVANIAGYAPDQSGKVLSMRKVLPWWDFRQEK